MTFTRRLGDAEVTALEVVTEERTAADLEEALLDPNATEIRATLDRHFGGSFPWSFAPALIRAGRERILFDTGNGFTTGPGRPIAELLAEAEIRPSELTAIVISHAHGDHIGGLIENGRATFPGVRLLFSREEYAFWSGAVSSDRYPNEDVAAVRKVFDCYADSIELVDSGSGDLIAQERGVAIRALSAAGHTPGHMGVEISSSGDRLWLLGDASHFLIQLIRPEWSPVWDADPVAGATTRRRLFEAAARERVLVQVYHYPFPGFGRIVRRGELFAWDAER